MVRKSCITRYCGSYDEQNQLFRHPKDQEEREQYLKSKPGDNTDDHVNNFVRYATMVVKEKYDL